MKPVLPRGCQDAGISIISHASAIPDTFRASVGDRIN